MDDLAHQGLFNCRSFMAYGEPTTRAFCKPMNIVIYTAPPPVYSRMVTYEMAYWIGTQQPSTPDEWAAVSPYISPYGNAATTFSFTMKPGIVDFDEILTLIRRHFSDIVIRGKQSLTRDKALTLVHTRNTTAFDNGLDGDEFRKVYHVLHIDHAILVDGLQYEHTSGELRYRGSDSKDPHPPAFNQSETSLIKCPHEYEFNGKLGPAALADFIAK